MRNRIKHLATVHGVRVLMGLPRICKDCNNVIRGLYCKPCNGE